MVLPRPISSARMPFRLLLYRDTSHSKPLICKDKRPELRPRWGVRGFPALQRLPSSNPARDHPPPCSLSIWLWVHSLLSHSAPSHTPFSGITGVLCSCETGMKHPFQAHVYTVKSLSLPDTKPHSPLGPACPQCVTLDEGDLGRQGNECTTRLSASTAFQDEVKGFQSLQSFLPQAVRRLSSRKLWKVS